MAIDARERPRRAEWLAETVGVDTPRARRPGMGEWDAGFGSEPGWGFKWRIGGRMWACLPGSFMGDLESSGEEASEQHVLPTSTPSSLPCPAPLLLFRRAYQGPMWGGSSAPSTDL